MMPCDTGLYSRLSDNGAELPYMGSGKIKVIESPSAHMAGLPCFNTADDAFVNKKLLELLCIPVS